MCSGLDLTLDIGTLGWPLAVVFVTWWFRASLASILDAVVQRLEGGSSFAVKLGAFEGKLGQLPEGEAPPVDARLSPGDQLRQIHGLLRDALIDRIGAKGQRGRSASLQRLATHALASDKISAEDFDRILEFEELARMARHAPGRAEELVTVSGTLLTHLR